MLLSIIIKEWTKATIQQFYAVLESIAKREEFFLDTPVNKTILEAIEQLKTSEEKQSIVKLATIVDKEWMPPSSRFTLCTHC